MPRGRYKRRNKLMQPTSVQLDRSLHTYLQREARKLETTMGALIRKILSGYRAFEEGDKGTVAPVEAEQVK